MSLWILDTDCVSLFLEGNAQIGERAASKFPDVAITIITVQEAFNGWAGKINDPSQANQLVWLYTKLWRTTEFFKKVTILNFIEFVVREALEASTQKLAGLYDGNPKRATERPSAKQLLKAFDNLTLYLLPDTSIFVTTLSALHRQMLSLLRLPDSIYSLHLKPRKT